MTTGYGVQPNKAVVGSSAFAHESGIHQHGVLANRATYEIMDPVEIGLEGNALVLGKHSGRHAFVDALDKIGITLDEDQLNRDLRAVQGPRRPQGADHRPRPRGDRRRGGRRDRRRTSSCWRPLRMDGGTAPARRAVTVRLRRGEEVIERVRDGRRHDRFRHGRDPTGRRRRGPPRELPRLERDRRVPTR